MAKAINSPARIGRYRIVAPLARGGMAEVYVVVRDGRDTPSVLKRLLLELEDHPTAALRFRRESELSTRLQHPRIVRTLRTAIEEGRPCIEMELIPGDTVEAMMLTLAHHQRLPPLDCVIRIALDALEGLVYAHELRDDEGRSEGLVHRDISPRNILLGLDGAARLIDFGIARAEWGGYLTAPGSILGTFSHASPEQAIAAPIDRRSDLYSLGVVLYEMVTGQSLVPVGETMEMLKRVTTVTPPLARELNPSLSAELERVLDRALQKRPEDRFQDADSFRAALDHAVPTNEAESRRRLAGLLGQLFPEGHATFRRYEEEARRIAAEEVVVPSQLGGEAGELTEQHTGLTELVGGDQRGSATLVVRKRTNSRESAVTTTIVDRDGGTVTEPRARMASQSGLSPPHERTTVGELRRRNQQLTRVVIALGVSLVGLGALVVVGPRTQAPSPTEVAEVPQRPAATPQVVREAPVAEPPEPKDEPELDTSEPREEPAEAESEPEPEPTLKRTRASRRTMREPEAVEPVAAPPSPAPKPSVDRKRARLEALGARLRADPSDGALFEETARALERALAPLPDDRKRALKARIQRAEVMNDVPILLGALSSYLEGGQ